MAFNLRAILRLEDDNFTKTMRKIERQVRRTESVMKKMSESSGQLSGAMSSVRNSAMSSGTAVNKFGGSVVRAGRSADTFRDSTGRLRDAMGGFIKDSNRMGRVSDYTVRSLTSIGNGAKFAFRGLTSLKTGFLGIAAAAGGAYTAVKIFKSTVGEAMKFEQSSIMIDAMFDNKKVSNEYKDMMQKMAIDSPLLNSQDIFGNSKSFIMLTKDNKQLKQMWSLVERLNAIDPAQGVEGAVFALKELFSGDARSLQERFELDRQTLKGIKNLPLEKQITELDKYFNRMGITQKLIDDMGGSTLGLWNQVNEQVELVLRKMGEPSLKVLSNFFENILKRLQDGDFKQFAQIGGRMIQSILSGLTTGIENVYEWFTGITSSPEFKEKTSLAAKVGFVIDDLFGKFKTWLKDNQKRINDMTKTLIETISSGLIAATPIIVETAEVIGSAVGSALVSKASQQLQDWSKTKMRESKWVPYPVKWGMEVGGYIEDKISGKKKKKDDKPSSSSGSFASGLDRVPYNGFQATLHKNERVLTPEESKEYRKGGGGITITGNTFNVREESDIDKIAEELYRRINGAIAAGA